MKLGRVTEMCKKDGTKYEKSGRVYLYEKDPTKTGFYSKDMFFKEDDIAPGSKLSTLSDECLPCVIVADERICIDDGEKKLMATNIMLPDEYKGKFDDETFGDYALRETIDVFLERIPDYYLRNEPYIYFLYLKRDFVKEKLFEKIKNGGFVKSPFKELAECISMECFDPVWPFDDKPEESFDRIDSIYDYATDEELTLLLTQCLKKSYKMPNLLTKSDRIWKKNVEFAKMFKDETILALNRNGYKFDDETYDYLMENMDDYWAKHVLCMVRFDRICEHPEMIKWFDIHELAGQLENGWNPTDEETETYLKYIRNIQTKVLLCMRKRGLALKHPEIVELAEQRELEIIFMNMERISKKDYDWLIKTIKNEEAKEWLRVYYTNEKVIGGIKCVERSFDVIKDARKEI